MNYIDYAIIAILVLGLIIGLFKGFIKPAFSILVWGAIIALIYFLGQQVADLIGATPLGDLIRNFVGSTLEPLGELGSETVVKNADGAWVIASSGVVLTDALSSIPSFIINIISGAFVENISLAENITTTLSNYFLLAISAVAIMIVVRIIFAIIYCIIKRFINIEQGAVNRVLGAILQLILACMFIFFVLFIIDLIMSLVQIETLKTLMQESAIVKFIGGFNPFELILKAVMKV